MLVHQGSRSLSQAPPPATYEHNDQDPNNLLNGLQRLRIAQAEWSKFFMHDGTNSSRSPNGTRSVQLSVANQRANIAWGDPLQDKPTSVTRVYVLNANGFSLDRRGGQFEEFCRTATEVQADIIGCQEHNLDTTQPSVKSILYDTAKKCLESIKNSIWNDTYPVRNIVQARGDISSVVKPYNRESSLSKRRQMGSMVQPNTPWET